MTKSLSISKRSLRTVGAVLCLMVTILWLCFIYGNSLKTGTESGEQSGTVYEIVSNVTNAMGLGTPISHHLIRKAAHFAEFALLGILVCLDLWSLGAVSLRRKLYVSAPILLCSIPIIAVFASVDELLQNFSEGRGPSPKDVLIDVSGAACAAMLFTVLFVIGYFVYQRSVARNKLCQLSSNDI